MGFADFDHESFYEAVLSAGPSAMLIVDEALTVLEASRGAVEQLRCDRAAVIGRRLAELYPGIFAESPLDRQIGEVIRSGVSLLRQGISWGAPGLPRQLRCFSICPLALRRAGRAAILTIDQIGDRRRPAGEARQHFAGIVESAPDPIISTDAAGAILTWNSAAQAVTGWSEGAVCGRPFAELIAAPQCEEAAAWFAARARDECRRSAEWPMICRRGPPIPISWSLARMTDGGGAVAGVVAIGRDLTAHRTLEAQVGQSERLAALGLVVGGIAHEIRNPLGVSSAAAQLLRRRTGSPAMQEECIEKIIAGIARASRVIENLLRFAQPGVLRETARVDLAEALRTALLFASGEAAAGTTVVWDVEGSQQALCADGVPALVELVMINLIANAFQAMPGGGRLSLGVRREADRIIVEIGDTGGGIAEADLLRVFDPFFTTRNDNRRAGLGLSISHSIVRRHGGTIAARSTSGEGTRFVVTLPASAATPREPASQPA